MLVAAVVEESCGEDCFVLVGVVGVEWSAVEVLVGVFVHGACAVGAFVAVCVVVEELLSSFVVVVPVTALGGGLFHVSASLFWFGHE